MIILVFCMIQITQSVFPWENVHKHAHYNQEYNDWLDWLRREESYEAFTRPIEDLGTRNMNEAASDEALVAPMCIDAECLKINAQIMKLNKAIQSASVMVDVMKRQF